MYFVGDGAERVEEYLRELFPKARIARLDRDTVRTKREFEQVLGAFAAGEIDMLVGTQMVAKGHDFQRVRWWELWPPIWRWDFLIFARPSARFNCSRKWRDARGAAS